MTKLSDKERRLFFLSFITMIFGLHFMFHFVTKSSYNFPMFFLAFFFVYLLPNSWQRSISHFLLSLMEPIGRFNGTLLYGVMYFGVLCPISLFRRSEVDLTFKDSNKKTYLIQDRHNDADKLNYKNPY